MSSSQYNNVVEKCYLAYYGRPGDSAGLAYWTARLEVGGGNLQGIIEAFASSAEATSLYGGLGNEAKITKIYQQLFNHDPDTAGLQYYLGQLNSGAMTIASIMLNVADGAIGTDANHLNTAITTGLASLDPALLAQQQDAYLAQLLPSNTVSLNSLHSGDVIDAGNGAYQYVLDVNQLPQYATGAVTIRNFGADDSIKLTDPKDVFALSSSSTSNVDLTTIGFNTNLVTIHLAGVNPTLQTIFEVSQFNNLPVGDVVIG